MEMLPERSSSPAIKRPASELEEEDEAGRGREDMTARAGSPLRNGSAPLGDYAAVSTHSMTEADTIGHPVNLPVDRKDAEENHETSEAKKVEISNGLKSVTRPGPAHATKVDHAQPVSARPISRLHEIPPVDEQISIVTRLSQRPLADREKAYVISIRWMKRVEAKASRKAEGGSTDTEAVVAEIGPVDNSDIVAPAPADLIELKDEEGKPFVPLKPGLASGEDFDFFTQEVWDLILGWYGIADHSPVITRFVHNTNPEGKNGTENLQYETYPPVFTIRRIRHGPLLKTSTDNLQAPTQLLASRSESFNHFLKRAKFGAGIPLASKVRVWRILGAPQQHRVNGILTPAASRSASPAPHGAEVSKSAVFMGLEDFLGLEDGSQREMLDVPDQTMNENYNGHLTLALAGLSNDGTIVLEELAHGAAGAPWMSEAFPKGRSTPEFALTITKDGETTAPNRMSTRSSTAAARATSTTLEGGMLTRGRLARNGRSMGTCGLSNLGNTCYMNSAIQCVRSVEELTQYFRPMQVGKYKAELNPSNPLSHNGDVARSYAGLLDQMYAPSCPASVPPRAFKNTIGRYGPSFSGYGQQDSQEFVGFLLDGLQEDLNRIEKKPYTEKPDSTDDMVNDAAALKVLADQCWEIYKARNDSVIVDLFAGTYKSTLVCPACDKVSITFDPFNNLTLQLPIENVWSKEIIYHPLNDRFIRVHVEIDKNASVKGLKEFVAGRFGVDARRLHVAEVYKNRFYKTYDDPESVVENMQGNDVIAVFELEDVPTNWPPRKTARGTTARSTIFSYGQNDDEAEPTSSDPALADKMLVPLFHRRTRDSRPPGRELFGPPSYIILTRDEVDDYDSILRKVLARVATMTTKNILAVETDESSVSPEEDDMVVTTPEDADPSAGTKTQNHSVDGEDDFVAISMQDPKEISPPTNGVHGGGTNSRPAARAPAKKASVLPPGSFIPPELRALFQMRVFSQEREIVPTGWHVDLENGHRELPLIESRIPLSRSQSPAQDMVDKSYMPGDGPSSESSSDQLSTGRAHFQSRHMGSDSDSDNNPVVREIIPRKKRGLYQPSKNNRRKGGKSKDRFFRKGKRNSGHSGYSGHSGHSGTSGHSSAKSTSHGPLVRLGEGIVLDWIPQAEDALFYGDRSSGDMKGRLTWDDVPLLPDEELKQKRVQRLLRKKKGVSLDDCLDEFGKQEILSENDAWYCPRCKEFRRASKKFELWKAPDILIIHLKRFSASRGLRDKIDILVDFPVEGLDLGPRIAHQEEGKSVIYDLFAVDNHYGGLGGGHYTAIAKNFVDGHWYDYNDTMTSKRSPDQAVTSAAYLLFYRRRSDKALGGPLFETILGEAHGPADLAPSSRTASPAGEGRRLDESSRVGSSSALDGVEAGRPKAADSASGKTLAAAASGGGEDDGEDELPPYTRLFPGRAAPGQHMEDMDVDEGVDVTFPLDSTGPFSGEATWAFDNMPRPSDRRLVPVRVPARAVSPDDEEEDLMDGASDKAADGSSNGPSERGDRMADFADDEDPDALDAALLPDDSFGTSLAARSRSESVVTDRPLLSQPGRLRVRAPTLGSDGYGDGQGEGECEGEGDGDVDGEGEGEDDEDDHENDEDDDGPVAEVRVDDDVDDDDDEDDALIKLD
ncbi:MAG: CSN-associated deubiquitinating enzyme Ubp12 [Phylliscum demangeonii]|nr:MAG: CSN-associated deubiquitinating enzyme Ubp12 [Phylliscum demangeonii]